MDSRAELNEDDRKLLADAVTIISKSPKGDSWVIGALLQLIDRLSSSGTTGKPFSTEEIETFQKIEGVG